METPQSGGCGPVAGHVSLRLSEPGCQPAHVSVSPVFGFDAVGGPHSATSTHIPGRLPNAVYTLTPNVTFAILKAANAPPEAYFLCRKTYISRVEHRRDRIVVVDNLDTLTVAHGRVFLDKAFPDGHTDTEWIRMPAVLTFKHAGGVSFARTSRGWVVWGYFMTGFECRRPSLLEHHRLVAPLTVMNVAAGNREVFVRTNKGWLAYGTDSYGQLGVNNAQTYSGPVFVVDGNTIVSIQTGYECSFAWTMDGMLACGNNDCGELGIGQPIAMRPIAHRRTPNTPAVFTPVALPAGVVPEAVVCRRYGPGCCTFFLYRGQCWACGMNDLGQLGLGRCSSPVIKPALLPIPVDGVTSDTRSTVILSAGRLLGCGGNPGGLLHPTTGHLTHPTPIATPDDVDAVHMDWGQLFVRTGADWFGRGANYPSRLGVDDDEDVVRGFTRVVNEGRCHRLTRDTMFIDGLVPAQTTETVSSHGLGREEREGRWGCLAFLRHGR